ncbi:MAG: ImmA/IrrE family metallo-endopeptidase [Sphingomicrobium sp.]
MIASFPPELERHRESAPVQLTAMAKALGVPVYLSTMPPSISGLIEPDESSESGFRIRINRHEIAERQRFTLAHEIAHFLLHRSLIGGGVVDDTMYRSALSSRREVEANKLAAELCMPRDLVLKERKLRQQLDDDSLVDELARVFKVSRQAMRIRLGV